jgi:biotin synthase
MEMNFSQILEKAADGPISPDEALFLFHESENHVNANKLFEAACDVRDREMGRTFTWSGGIASILPCRLNPLCSYCSYWQSEGHQLTIDEILKGVRYIEDHGLTNFHLSGGTTLGDDGKEVLDIVRSISAMSHCELTVNVGAALSEETIVELKKLGVSRIGASFETVNENLFKKFKAGDSLEAKKTLAEIIDEHGIGLGSGVLAGLNTDPSRYKDYVDFMFYVRGFKNLKSVYVSRFFPYNDTPMENHPRCSAMEGSRIIAIMRLVLKDVDIGPAAGWSYDDIPMWIMAGGGNRIGGIHVNRAPKRRSNWYLHSALEYRDRMEYTNTMPTAARLLAEIGVTDIKC